MKDAATTGLATPSSLPRGLAAWLFGMALAVLLMVVIGGSTRLTESGLSITEWDLFKGTLPPIHQQAWESLFEKYKETPQYLKVNSDMTLGDFKSIFWWEYLHRLWGRLLGVFFFLPMVWFVWRGVRGLWLKRLLIAFLLGGAQGFLGWFMVQSGLIDIPRVSPYRLSAHLLFATFLFGYLLWLAWLARDERRGTTVSPSRGPLTRLGWLTAGLIFVQIAWGGFMAGTRSAKLFPTFPTMNGEWLPDSVYTYDPLLLAPFENPATIQFTHRLLALAVLVMAAVLCWKIVCRVGAPMKPYAWTIAAVVTTQITLGIVTVMLSIGKIPVLWGVLHQAVGLVLLATVLWTTHRLRQTGA